MEKNKYTGKIKALLKAGLIISTVALATGAVAKDAEAAGRIGVNDHIAAQYQLTPKQQKEYDRLVKQNPGGVVNIIFEENDSRFNYSTRVKGFSVITAKQMQKAQESLARASSCCPTGCYHEHQGNSFRDGLRFDNSSQVNQIMNQVNMKNSNVIGKNVRIGTVTTDREDCRW